LTEVGGVGRFRVLGVDGVGKLDGGNKTKYYKVVGPLVMIQVRKESLVWRALLPEARYLETCFFSTLDLSLNEYR